MKLFSARTLAYTVLGLAFSAGTAYASVNVSCTGNSCGAGSGILGAGSVDVSATNHLTGPNSENINKVELGNHHSSGDIDIDNNAHLNNDVDLSVETGKNDIDCNTVVGDISTGDANADISVESTIGNGGFDMGSYDPGSISVDFANELTGPNSDNHNTVNVDSGFGRSVDVDNHATVNNDLDLSANTGHNKIKNNTKVGDVSTGSIDLSGTVKNVVNSGSMDLGGLLSQPSVTADFTNDTTGPCSDNTNILNVGSGSGHDVNIDNSATIHNDLNVKADTGHNSVGNNTVVGDVSTGNVSVGYTVMNTAN
jgi:hypothetical protein